MVGPAGMSQYRAVTVNVLKRYPELLLVIVIIVGPAEAHSTGAS
jgi:hypothetical protein